MNKNKTMDKLKSLYDTVNKECKVYYYKSKSYILLTDISIVSGIAKSSIFHNFKTKGLKHETFKYIKLKEIDRINNTELSKSKSAYGAGFSFIDKKELMKIFDIQNSKKEDTKEIEEIKEGGFIMDIVKEIEDIEDIEEINNKIDAEPSQINEDMKNIIEDLFSKYLLLESLKNGIDFSFTDTKNNIFNPFLSNVYLQINSEYFYLWAKSISPCILKPNLLYELYPLSNFYCFFVESSILILFDSHFLSEFPLSEKIKSAYNELITNKIANYLTVDNSLEILNKTDLKEDICLNLLYEVDTTVTKELKKIHDYTTELYNKGIIVDEDGYIFSDKFYIGCEIEIKDITCDISQRLTVLNNYGNKIEAFTLDTKTENINGKARIQTRNIDVKSCLSEDVKIKIIDAKYPKELDTSA